jgi:hypothetical protein
MGQRSNKRIKPTHARSREKIGHRSRLIRNYVRRARFEFVGGVRMKTLNASNWREPDPTIEFFCRLDAEGRPRAIAPEEWIADILKPDLEPAVPEDVRALFEVARGAMVYGYLFYPLYTLAGEQLLRVTEAAATHRCRQLGAPSRIKRFEAKVDWLVEHRALPEADYSAWNATRQMRNHASHPTAQSIYPPAFAIRGIESTAQLINRLFSATESQALA